MKWCRNILFVFVLCVLTIDVWGGKAWKFGDSFIENINSTVYKGDIQIWAIERGEDGYMFLRRLRDCLFGMGYVGISIRYLQRLTCAVCVMILGRVYYILQETMNSGFGSRMNMVILSIGVYIITKT